MLRVTFTGERKRQRKRAAAGSTNEAPVSRDTSLTEGREADEALDEFMEMMGSTGTEEAIEMCFPQEPLDAAQTGMWATAVTVATSPLDSGQFVAGMEMPGLLSDSPDTEAGGVCLSDTNQQATLSSAFPVFGVDPSALSITAASTSPSSNSASSDSAPPDSYHLPLNELTILRAIHRISQRLNIQSFWSLEDISPFTTGTAAPAHTLPAHWRPTPSQLSVPHHPIIDFMPWPGVRERLIAVLALPEEARPGAAAGPLALVNFAYDFEDGVEGVRIRGEDVYDPESWEVGQVLFERWWFLFDRGIVENSNRLRRLRGAAALKIGGGRPAG